MTTNRWQQQTRDGEWVNLNTTADKKARQKFRLLMDTTGNRRDWNPTNREGIDEDPDHLVLGGGRRDGTKVTLIGFAADLHGPNGVCTCCHGRAA